MNKPNYEVKLIPQLGKACGLDLHKDKIVGFISDKDGTKQDLQEYGTLMGYFNHFLDWYSINREAYFIYVPDL